MSWVERLVEDCHWQADDGEVRAIARRAIEEAARRCRGDRAYMSTEVERAVARIRAMLADDGAEEDG